MKIMVLPGFRSNADNGGQSKGSGLVAERKLFLAKSKKLGRGLNCCEKALDWDR